MERYIYNTNKQDGQTYRHKKKMRKKKMDRKRIRQATIISFAKNKK